LKWPHGHGILGNGKGNSMKVHVLVIHHRHGINLSAHDTAKGAEEEVGRYVADEWADEIQGEEYPKDSSTAIKTYFEKVESEYAEIEELTIQAEH